jgi:hypothetical protein
VDAVADTPSYPWVPQRLIGYHETPIVVDGETPMQYRIEAREAVAAQVPPRRETQPWRVTRRAVIFLALLALVGLDPVLAIAP